MEEEVKALLEQIESLKRCFPDHHAISDGIGAMGSVAAEMLTSGVDLVLSCVDNYKARMVVNQEEKLFLGNQNYVENTREDILGSLTTLGTYNEWSGLIILHKSLFPAVHIPDGLIHELPKADEFQKLLVFEETIDLSHRRPLLGTDES
ncbi:Ubiquitin-like modifier-activating enzyme 5 [Acorus calamus]|uniref:Ubiquitin-like modifier-activating enzyme 5 n=1 Tax=Acorus calamus TaxID=4465 RepID=A0AAV9BXZ9_ACOCL|nr:Ubiquitin-like modifier-activating enzyme 5 [Acorus calamus]